MAAGRGSRQLSIYLEIDADPAKMFAAHTLSMCHQMTERMMAYRDAMPAEEERKRFCDVRMDDLTSDPIGVVRRVYDKFGLTYTPEYEEALKDYIAKHGNKEGGPKTAAAPVAPGEVSPHQRTLALLGLSQEDLDSKFRKYRERYDV